MSHSLWYDTATAAHQVNSLTIRAMVITVTVDLNHKHTASMTHSSSSGSTSGSGGSSGSSGSNNSTKIDWDCLPTSVRGAPPELRRLIRKRQNSESAKRCRQRRKLEKLREANTATSHATQMRQLQAYVAQLAERLTYMQSVLATLLPQHQQQHDGVSSPTSPPPPPPAPPAVPSSEEYLASFADTVDELAMSWTRIHTVTLVHNCSLSIRFMYIIIKRNIVRNSFVPTHPLPHHSFIDSSLIPSLN